MLRVLVIVTAMIAVLTMVYVVLSATARRRRARELEAEYRAGAGHALTREDFVARGLAEFDRSIPKRTILAIFAAPVLVVAALAILASLG